MAFSGKTALMLAAENGHAEAVKLLLAGKADVEAKTGMEPKFYQICLVRNESARCVHHSPHSPHDR